MLELCKAKLKIIFKILTTVGLGQTNLSINYNKNSYIILNRPKGDTAIFNISINSQQICEKNDLKIPRHHPWQQT